MNPPKGLSKEATALWRLVSRTCKMRPDEVVLLKIACQSFGEMEKARKLLHEHGFVIKDPKTGIRVNPAAQILKDSRQAFLRSWKALNFKSEDDLHKKKPGRPPARNEFQYDDEAEI